MRTTGAHASRFTLIELMVVVAICSILATIILPALSQAKIKSQGTVGSDQERQMSTGFTMYADDYDGNLYQSPGETVPFGDETPGLFKHDSTLTFTSSILSAAPGGPSVNLGAVAREYRFDHLSGHPVVGAKAWTDAGNTAPFGWSPWWYYPGYLQTKKDNWYPPVPPFPTAPIQIARASGDHVLMSEMVVENYMGMSLGNMWRAVHIRGGGLGNSHDGSPNTDNSAFAFYGTNDPAMVKGTYATFYDGRTEWVPFADLKFLFVMCYAYVHRYENIYFPPQPEK